MCMLLSVINLKIRMNRLYFLFYDLSVVVIFIKNFFLAYLTACLTFMLLKRFMFRRHYLNVELVYT